jgi:hypothetical protein
MKTIGDIAIELRDYYRVTMEMHEISFFKGEKNKIFNGIVDELFEKYREELGYENTSTHKSLFKSEIIIAKNNLKRTNQKNFYLNPYNDEELMTICAGLNKTPAKITGELFILNQIEKFGLNPDSY